MKPSAPAPERNRTAQRSGVVFIAAVGSTGLVILVGLGLLLSACADSISHLLDSVGPNFASEGFLSGNDVKPIPVPQDSCPYLRLVSGAATNAGAPWHDAFSGSASLARLRRDLPTPLAALDVALGAAIPNVPAPVARDLRAVRDDVQFGRVELLAATSADEYLEQSKVIDGYSTLVHASGLVGSACGAPIAPPLPF